MAFLPVSKGTMIYCKMKQAVRKNATARTVPFVAPFVAVPFVACDSENRPRCRTLHRFCDSENRPRCRIRVFLVRPFL
jgi:hypothetical protein